MTSLERKRRREKEKKKRKICFSREKRADDIIKPLEKICWCFLGNDNQWHEEEQEAGGGGVVSWPAQDSTW